MFSDSFYSTHPSTIDFANVFISYQTDIYDNLQSPHVKNRRPDKYTQHHQQIPQRLLKLYESKILDSYKFVSNAARRVQPALVSKWRCGAQYYDTFDYRTAIIFCIQYFTCISSYFIKLLNTRARWHKISIHYCASNPKPAEVWREIVRIGATALLLSTFLYKARRNWSVVLNANPGTGAGISNLRRNWIASASPTLEDRASNSLDGQVSVLVISAIAVDRASTSFW